MKSTLAHRTVPISHLLSWAFGVLAVVIGVLNLVLVHPVPGVAYLLASLIYFPPVNIILKRRLGFAIPVAVKIILGIIIIQFTFGVSDLGDMVD